MKKTAVINIIPLYIPLTGVGKCTYYIAKKSKDFFDCTYYDGTFSKSISHVLFINRLVGKASRFNALFSLLKRMKSIFFKPKTESPYFDLYIEPNFIPIPEIKASFVIAIVYDFSFHLYPQWHPAERVRFFKENFWKNIELADRIVVISDFILNQAKELGLPEKKLIKIYPGVDHTIFRPYPEEVLRKIRKKYNLPESFILFVGSIEPRKNLIGLLKAYSILSESIKKKTKLLIAGFSGWKNKEIIRKMKEEKVIYLGYVPEKDLAAIYNIAEALIYPSFYEGFGLPPVEAMACGCPVIVSNTASLPEVCSDSAIYINPQDPEDIAKKITLFLTSANRREMKEKAIERAKRFSWQDTVSQIASLAFL